MTNIFYEDGFQDCINYRGYLPPNPPNSTDVSINNADRYREGYEAAQRIIAQGKKSVSKYRDRPNSTITGQLMKSEI